MFLETDRLYLRKINQDDFEELKSMLQDPDVMYAWEYTFSDEDVQSWIDKNIDCYRQYNLGYFFAVDKQSNEIVGQVALMPDIIDNRLHYEVGYILKKQYWHCGYARECVKSLVQYAFSELDLKEVIFEIRPGNAASRKVAEFFDAQIRGQFIKNVRGKKMLHLIYVLNKEALRWI